MTSDSSERIESSDGSIEAVLFEAISHPTRIKILFSLESKAMGFADLKRALGITSSGNLQHHISKLATLVGVNTNGDYVLSDQGMDALVTIRSLRNTHNSQNQQQRTHSDKKMATLGASLGYYIIQMNMPYIYGTTDALTPVYALISSVLFAGVFFLFFTYFMKRSIDTGE